MWKRISKKMLNRKFWGLLGKLLIDVIIMRQFFNYTSLTFLQNWKWTKSLTETEASRKVKLVSLRSCTEDYLCRTKSHDREGWAEARVVTGKNYFSQKFFRDTKNLCKYLFTACWASQVPLKSLEKEFWANNEIHWVESFCKKFKTF